MNENEYYILSVSTKTPSYNERFVVLYSKDGRTALSGWMKEKECINVKNVVSGSFYLRVLKNMIMYALDTIGQNNQSTPISHPGQSSEVVRS